MICNIDGLETALEKIVEELELFNSVHISKLGNRITISCNGAVLYYILGCEVNNCITQRLFIGLSNDIICYHIKDNLVDTINRFKMIQNAFNFKSTLVESKLRALLDFSFNFNALGTRFFIETDYNKFDIYYIGNGKYKVESQINLSCDEHDLEILTKTTEALDGLVL